MGWSTPVLLHFNGTNGSTVYPNDAPGLTFSNVPSGVASLSTTTPPLGSAWLFGGADNQLGGVVSNLPITIPRGVDFSIEGRFQTTNKGFNGFVFSIGDLSLNARSLALRLNSDVTNLGDLRIFIGGQLCCFSAAVVANSTPLAYGVFRIAGVLYLTINGALQGVWPDNGVLGGGNLYIGNCLSGGSLASIGSSFNLSHDEVRVTIGLARQKVFPYTVATTAFVLDGQPGPTVVALAKKRERTLFGGADTGGGAVTAALTGVSGTGSVGTVGVTVVKALTGNSGTGSPGTVVPSASIAITGNTGTGSVGMVAPSASVALTGTTGTGSAGTVSAAVVVALSGVSATGSVGTVTAANGGTTVALTGVTATGSVGTVSVAADKALTGVSGTGSAGTVTAALSKVITGNSATGSVGTVSPAASVALSGVSGTGSAGTTTGNVSVSVSGVSATGSVGTVTPAQGGTTVDLTGVSATGSVGQPGVNVVIALSGVTGTGSAGALTVAGTGGGGIDTWGSVYVRTKKKKKEPEAIPVAGPVVREFIEAAMQAHEPPGSKTAVRQPAVINDEDEEEILMLLL